MSRTIYLFNLTKKEIGKTVVRFPSKTDSLPVALYTFGLFIKDCIVKGNTIHDEYKWGKNDTITVEFDKGCRIQKYLDEDYKML